MAQLSSEPVVDPLRRKMPRTAVDDPMSGGIQIDAETGELGEYQRHNGTNVAGIATLFSTWRAVSSPDMKNGVWRSDPIDAATRKRSRLGSVDHIRRELQRRGAAV